MQQLPASKRDIVVIGASAGGVEALTAFFKALPPKVEAAFLVVLHIPAHAPSRLDQILSRVTSLSVVVAEDGEPLVSGRVYVASPDKHLMVTPQGVRLSRGPKEGRSRPSIDVLFRSAAVAFQSRVIGVVLSGMLDDGTAGLWAIRDHQGVALVQDPAEALHAPMPQSAIAHVQVDFVGTVQALSDRVALLASEEVAMPEDPARLARLGIENHIALGGNGLKVGVMDLGKVSKYTCPDCHGVLVQIEEGSIVRFRCHTGHAYSLTSLIAEVNESIDKGLWGALRAGEERVMLMRQAAEVADAAGATHEAQRCQMHADQTEKRLEPLRVLVHDSEFFNNLSANPGLTSMAVQPGPAGA